jgi:hypothetical protein
VLQHVLNGIGDVGIGAAAAEVSAHMLPDFGAAVRMSFSQQSSRGADLARGAVAALERVMLDKSGLERMQFVSLGQALDGRDLGSIPRYG